MGRFPAPARASALVRPRPPSSAFVFHLIPHTHWDREWYLPRAAFQARLVPVLDDVVERLEGDGRVRAFLLDGQTVHVEDYLRVRPERRERVAALVGAGRLQVGPWYVLADEQVPSAESMVRNLLLGMKDAAALGGRLDVMYSPDAFGHPAAWPSLAAEFGLPYGALWRGLGDTGGDLVRWVGADGGAVVLYHLPPDGYEVGASLPADPARLREAWPPLRELLVARARTRHVAVLVGADHHALHPALGELRDALAELERAGGAEVRVSRLDEFLARAAAEVEAARDGATLPELRGELRWSYGYTWTLQGVHGTRAHQKRRNAAVELLLERSAEPLAALARLRGVGGDSPAALLEHAWRTLVRAHFHDTLGGCCADPVARAAERRFDDAARIAGEVARHCGDALVGHDPDAVRRGDAGAAALLLWNPAARRRGGEVVVAELTGFRRDVFVGPPSGRAPRTGPGLGDVALVAADGGAVPVQLLHRDVVLERRDAPHHYPDLDEVDRVRIAFRAPAVGGLGVARLDPVPSGGRVSPDGDVRIAGSAIANEVVSVGVTADGRLLLTDLRSGEHWADLLAIESEHDVGDTYTVQPGRWRVAHEEPVAVRVLAAGPLVGAIEARTRLRLPTGSVSLAVRVELRAGERAVRLSLALDNRATDHRLRLRLPVGVRGAAVAGGQFGALRRDPVLVRAEDFPRETPVATAPAHRFVGAARGARGLALLAPGFFEYEWTPDGDLLFTVLRAVGELSRGDLATRPGNAGWATPTPEAQVQGPDHLQFALLPIDAETLADEAAMLAAWEDLFLPVRGVWHRETTAPAALPPFGVELEGEGLVHSACKPASTGDGVILRCYNATDRPARGRWRFAAPVAAAERVRADESALGPLPVEAGGRVVPFDAPPRAIVTIRVVP